MVIAWDVLNSPETLFELAGGEFHVGNEESTRRMDVSVESSEELQFTGFNQLFGG